MSVPDERLQEQVETALRQVEDPQAGMNVFEAGLIDDIRIDDAEVVVEAAVYDLDAETSQAVNTAILQAVTDVPAVDRAHVERGSPGSEDAGSIDTVDTVVAVASTKGGVGKTTVATHLACAMAAADDVALFDADVYGPNVPSILDVEGPILADEEDRPVPVTTGGMEVLSVDLLTEAEGGPLAWRGAMAHDALTELFETVAWSNRETMVVDLPPGTGDIALTTLQEAAIDGVVFVTTPFHTSLEDTRRSLELFEENGVPVLGVVVNMDHFACECGREHDLFAHADGDLDAALDVPVLARLPFTDDLQGRPIPGDPPEVVRSLETAVRDRLAETGRIDVADDAVDLRGRQPRKRYELVRDAFTALDAGERMHVVSDRDPTPAGEFLVDVLDAAGPPAAVLEEFTVERRGPDEWVLVAQHP